MTGGQLLVVTLPDVSERFIDHARFRLALMLFKVRLQLLLGFVRILQKFLPCPEGKPADVAIRIAGGGPDKSDDLKTSIWHLNIIARVREGVK